MDRTTTDTTSPNGPERDHAAEAHGLSAVNASQSLDIDWRAYDDLLATSGMSEAQKAEFVETLASIALSFVDLWLGLHPAQLATGDHDIEEVMRALLDEWMKEEGLNE